MTATEDVSFREADWIMWAKLDDTFLDHPKIAVAGDVIGGGDGQGIALGTYILAVLWATRHLSDGFVPFGVMAQYDCNEAATALVGAGLFKQVKGGFQIHDFDRHGKSAADVMARRDWDRRRIRLQRDPAFITAVLTRDQSRCRYCGCTVDWLDRRAETGAQFDHVQPRGPNTLDNIVVACRSCNSKKRSRTPAEADMTLLPPPTTLA